VQRSLRLRNTRLRHPAPWYWGVWAAMALAWAGRAHTPSATFLQFTVSPANLTGFWDVAVRDLQQGYTHGVETKVLAPAEMEERLEALALDTVARLLVKLDGTNLVLAATDYLPVLHEEVEYKRLQFLAKGFWTNGSVLEVDAKALFGVDSNMHGFLRLEHNGRIESASFNVQNPVHRFSLVESGSHWDQWISFVTEGVWHIWIGFDHILFLLALLLPAVLHREETGWTPVSHLRPALLEVLKIVTAFTVAHSVTLSLAALGIVRPPSRIIESAIAVSVALAALNNLWAWFRGKSWWVAFGFGLIHGFGFANVLGELGLSEGSLARALVGFNVGVELGQMAIVSVFLPVAFAMRRTAFYRTGLFQVGSAVVVVIATIWLMERSFDISLLEPLAGRLRALLR